MSMSLQQWDDWHSENALKNPVDIQELLYLVDVELPETVQNELEELNPLLDIMDDTGPLCLNHYIFGLEKQITRPHMRSKLYIAPVLIPGAAILTPPHWDGHGTQTSIHTVLFGSGYNLVQIWNLAPLPDVQNQFRSIVQLPPADQPQHLPHDEEYSYDTSPTAWHTRKKARLLSVGIKSHVHKLKPGNSLLLRGGWPHTFKKVMDEPIWSVRTLKSEFISGRRSTEHFLSP